MSEEDLDLRAQEMMKPIRKSIQRLGRMCLEFKIDIAYRLMRIANGPTPLRPPVFIVGCGHSGTSLLLAVLGSHVKLHAIPFESGIAFAPVEDRDALLEKFDRMTIAAGKERWVEKTPRHIRRIEEILEFGRNPQIILMVRDGRDVVCSLQQRISSFDMSVERWVQDNRAGIPFWSHPQVYVLKYERLIEDFEGTMRDVCRFLEEDFDPQLLEHHKQPKRFYSRRIRRPNKPRQHNELRNWQINQPVFDGRGRWRTELHSHNLRRFEERAGEMMRACGYRSGP